MAEGVALAAGVLALAQTGWHVSKGLFDLAAEVSTAGEAVRVFASDFWLFVETVRTLGDLLKSLPPVSRRAQSTTEELLEVALEQVVEPFQQLLSNLEPLLVRWRNSPNRMRQLGVRIQWAFSCKKKVLFYHAALNALKSNVSLLLQVMSLRSQNPPHIRFILCTSVEETIASLRGGTQIPVSRLSRSAHERTRDGRRITRKPVRNSAATDARPAQSSTSTLSSEMALILITDGDNPDEVDEIGDSLSGIPLLKPEPADDSMEDELEHEEQLEAFGAIRAVQKRVIRLADEAMSASGSAPDVTTGSSAPPSRTRTDSNGIPPQQEEVASQNRTSDRTHQHYKSKPAARRESRRGAVDATGAAAGVIYFADTLGSAFEIPFEQVGCWQAMHAFIEAEYKVVRDFQLSVISPPHPGRYGILRGKHLTPVETIQEDISLCKYTMLYSDDGVAYNMVIAQDWERVARSGGRVRISLDDESLRKLTLLGKFREPSLERLRLARMAAAAAAADTTLGRRKGHV